MKLKIDTGKKNRIFLEIIQDKKTFIKKEFEVNFTQAEVLLPEINNLLKSIKKTPKDLSEIIVEDRGDSFTALRIGITIANTLAYSLSIPVFNTRGENISLEDIKLVTPKYSSEPNITISKKKV